MTTFASPDDAAVYAQDRPEGYLECRSNANHSWKTKNVKVLPDGFELTQECRSCLGFRFLETNLAGRVLRTRRHYPDGYLTERGTGRIVGDARDVIRLESITRYVKAANARARAAKRAAKAPVVKPVANSSRTKVKKK